MSSDAVAADEQGTVAPEVRPAPGRPWVEPVGHNDARLWGLSTEERLRRIAKAQGLPERGGPEDAILVNLRHVFDPAWLQFVAAERELVVTLGGVPVLARSADPEVRDAVRSAMLADAALPPGLPVAVTAHESVGALANKALRKRERPFMARLTAGNRAELERVSYFASYKGVTDLLTKYLWPEWALWLTRLAARLGVSPNMVTTVGALFCLAATVAFWNGHYWTGLALGLAFMVLDTVDGKLARCTITSSKWGNVFDHGIDLVHPLFWWYAWGVGLEAYGRPLDRNSFIAVMVALFAGYVVQRLIEGAFMVRYGMHIHVWRPIDSQFRLITARRNPNMVILFVALLFGRPEVGLVAVAVWTVVSCLFHLVRLAQAWAAERRGEPVLSWLG